MKLTMVSHSSVLIEQGPIALLTDPWFMGEVFNESWSLLCPTLLSPSTLDGITHIWISHEHPDHLHFPTLKNIPAGQKAKITLLYQKHFSSRVVEALDKLGFRQVIELPLGRWFELAEDVSVMCCSVGTIDSLLAVRTPSATVLNMNDCVMTATAARFLKRRIGQVDILLTQFSIANWSGNPDDTETAGANEVLNRARLYIDIFKPGATIPFASFVYFSHEENRHMNRWVNTPDRVLERLSDAPTQLQFLYNGDSWSSQVGFSSSGDPLQRYRSDFAGIADRQYRSHKPHSQKELLDLGQQLVEEVRPRFPGVLLKGVSPVCFYIDDLNQALSFDLRQGLVATEERERSACDLALSSQALWFAFKFPWGFSTLEVSGRYTRINPKVNKRALYLCHLNSSDIHFRGLITRLMQKRVWSFCWTKRREVLSRLLR